MRRRYHITISQNLCTKKDWIQRWKKKQKFTERSSESLEQKLESVFRHKMGRIFKRGDYLRGASIFTFMPCLGGGVCLCFIRVSCKVVYNVFGLHHFLVCDMHFLNLSSLELLRTLVLGSTNKWTEFKSFWKLMVFHVFFPMSGFHSNTNIHIRAKRCWIDASSSNIRYRPTGKPADAPA